jgi:hypothetical protein
MYTNGVIKPIKIVKIKMVRRDRVIGLFWLKYIICMYGNITIKPFVQLTFANKNKGNKWGKDINRCSVLEPFKNRVIPNLEQLLV